MPFRAALMFIMANYRQDSSIKVILTISHAQSRRVMGNSCVMRYGNTDGFRSDYLLTLGLGSKISGQAPTTIKTVINTAAI